MTDQPMALAAISKTLVARRGTIHVLLDRLADRAGLRAWAQPVTFLGLGMLAIVYALMSFLTINDRQEAVANAIKHSDNLVRITDQAYSRILQSADSTLLFVRHTYSQSPSAIDLQSLFNDPAIRTDLDHHYLITDARGRVIAATTMPGSDPVGRDFSGNESFQRQKNAPNDALFISPPLSQDSTGRLQVFLTRRLTSADGSFAGVVAAVLDPSALTRVGSDLDLGPLGTFGLVGFDGLMRARAVQGQFDLTAIGKRFVSGTTLLARSASAPTGHFWNTPGMFDNTSRLVSYRVIGHYPMIATVTMSKEEIFH